MHDFQLFPLAPIKMAMVMRAVAKAVQREQGEKKYSMRIKMIVDVML